MFPISTTEAEAPRTVKVTASVVSLVPKDKVYEVGAPMSEFYSSKTLAINASSIKCELIRAII